MNGNGHGIRSGVARPPTMLVTELDTGAFLVQDCQTSVVVYVGPYASDALRAALDTVFDDTAVLLNVPPIVKPRI